MQLIHGDCISAMEQMPDGSVDLILTDPPYNIKVKRTKSGKARTEEWDCIKDYPDFMMRWITQAHRVLKPQGVMYFFHNDMNQLPEIMERIRKETDFALISFMIWDKVNYRTNRWKNGKSESPTALRSKSRSEFLRTTKKRNSRKDGHMSWQNYIIRMEIPRSVWISVMRWFSGSVTVNMS